MKTRFLLLFLVSGIVSGTMGQILSIDLTFTAVDSSAYVQLDSIKVMNRTQGCDTVLYWPDTVLWDVIIGIDENPRAENAFKVFQNYPNPLTDQTTISLYVPEKDKVSIIITDILGRVIVESERVLYKGKHFFRFKPGNGNLCFFTAIWQGHSSSIKILQSGFHSCEAGTLEYTGGEDNFQQLKSRKDLQYFDYNRGDELLYIGYAATLQSGMLDSPDESTTYTFQFATNIPCPGTPTVEYQGQVYNTIQIFSQCWLKENLNVGIMVPSNQNMLNNSIIEKYCYHNNEDSCTKYGGLYQWDEIMQYNATQGVQGICPPGWHVPTDEEWKVLEGAVDSQYGIGDPEWDNVNPRGFDADKNLKTTNGWYSGVNGTDLFGFSCLPGGYVYYGGIFIEVGESASFWTSNKFSDNSAWGRKLWILFSGIFRNHDGKLQGESVRCLRD